MNWSSLRGQTIGDEAIFKVSQIVVFKSDLMQLEEKLLTQKQNSKSILTQVLDQIGLDKGDLKDKSYVRKLSTLVSFFVYQKSDLSKKDFSSLLEQADRYLSQRYQLPENSYDVSGATSFFLSVSGKIEVIFFMAESLETPTDYADRKAQ